MQEPYISDEEKTRLGLEALKTFFDSLGENTIYKQILLEEFFRFILGNNKHDLSMLEEERQDECDPRNDVRGPSAEHEGK